MWEGWLICLLTVLDDNEIMAKQSHIGLLRLVMQSACGMGFCFSGSMQTDCFLQVNGGSQSFNVVNQLRILGRWMRMVTIPNQSSVPKAWTEFEENGRMKATAYRARVVDVAEELYKFTIVLRAHSPLLVDRYSEREEIRQKGRLQSQAEKESVNAALTAGRS